MHVWEDIGVEVAHAYIWVYVLKYQFVNTDELCALLIAGPYLKHVFLF